jgi:hypothetical protein
MSQGSYTSKLIDFLFYYEMLITEFKKIYPIYKINPENTEINSTYNRLNEQINDVYLLLDDLITEVENDNINKENKLDKINRDISESKRYYKTHEPLLKDIISNSKGDIPREKQYIYRLNNKYIDFTYLLSLLSLLGFFFYKLLY